jgi:polar amino acid transport system substrate-binding protein
LTDYPISRLLFAVVLLVAVTGAADAQPRQLRWAGDPEGGAPFVEADPADPARLVGLDVEVAEVIARGTARTAVFTFVQFQSIEQAVDRGDADIGLSGIEDTPARRAAMAPTIPYYEFREVITVRKADAAKFRTLQDLAGHRVGTLGGTIAYEILLNAARRGVQAVSYDDDVHPYEDLLLGRVDAVVLDHVLAERRSRAMPGLAIQPVTVATGHYVGLLAQRNEALQTAANEALRGAMRDGRLERILRKWGVWNDDQPKLYARLLAGEPVAPVTGIDEPIGGAATMSRWQAARQYLPSLARAAGVTLLLSCLSMAAAVAIGAAIATGRVYGNRPVRLTLTGYVELMRGTPILLQLFVIYYGLAAVIKLPAFTAALAGLALNYAAYESEIYRGALEAVPVGQLEAARTLGFTERQVLRFIRAPQAFRFALAPMTNDFVALLKDSSLVSVLTVMELTKETQVFATNLGSWVVPGSICAAMYLMMSLPVAAAARRLERRSKVAAR